MIATLPQEPILPYQRTSETRAQLAARLGISVGHLRRRLAQDREAQRCVEQVRIAREKPLVEVVNGRVEGLHYNLSHDQASRLPSGLFLINTSRGVRVMSAGDDESRTQPEKRKPPAKFKPRTQAKKNKPAARVAG